ncbi:hypothetical protein QFC22_003138 [Naganishia vaughanmartiniae]|uniref:Uncharacterized protein n=1 Tax=Naganishia vaughanmartiniae TaxID=1424756 RepID=A0ACC2X8X0_9TREE|nr:hypothetical protein QFC22_003138 [Naganishia vaughanmartiniae]
MDPFLDFDDTSTQQHQPIDLIDYLTASSSAPHSATEDGFGHWAQQQNQEMDHELGTDKPLAERTSSSSSSSDLAAPTRVIEMFSYPSPINTSDALAASLGFHLGDGTFDNMNTQETEEGLSDDALARLLFAPSSDPFMATFERPEGDNIEREQQEQERELAAAYAAFAQQQTPAQHGWFTQQQPSQQYSESAGGYGYNHDMQSMQDNSAQQQQLREPITRNDHNLFPFSALGNDPRTQHGMETTLSAFPTNTQEPQRFSIPKPEYTYDHVQLAHNTGHHAQDQADTHAYGHGHGHSPASTLLGVHSTSSPTASHGAVSFSLHPSTQASSSSSSSSIGLSPSGTSGTSGSPVHAHATPTSSSGGGGGQRGQVGGGGGGLKPFVVAEGMTLAPQLLNVNHHQHQQHQQLNASMIGSGLVPDGRRGSVNVVEMAISGIHPLPQPSTTTTTTEKPSVKLHNKVEKRYRYNVKNALETLRDAVPRLRQVYKTSLPLELATTDVEDAQGLMGGLERLGKPTKKTVMLGARLYIEYLETEQRVAQVKVKRGEEVVRRLCGDDEWIKWVEGTEEEVARVRADYVALLEDKARIRAEASEGMERPLTAGPQQVKGEQEEEDDEEDEDEEDERPKKRTKKEVLAAEGKTGGKARKGAAGSAATTGAKRKSRTTAAAATTTTTTTSSISATAVSAFYSFGLAYMVFPRATSLFGSTTTPPALSRNTSSSSHSVGGARGKVLLAAAKSAEELGRRALPSHRVPDGDTILDGIWVVLLGLAMTVFALWIARKSRDSSSTRGEVVVDGDEAEDGEDVDGEGQEKWERLSAELGVGTVSGLVEEVVARIPMVGRPIRVSQSWYKSLSAFVGGGEFLPWQCRDEKLTCALVYRCGYGLARQASPPSTTCSSCRYQRVMRIVTRSLLPIRCRTQDHMVRSSKTRDR